MGHLDVLRVEVADVRRSDIAGITGSGSLLLILRGQVIVGIDLAKSRVSKGTDGVYTLSLPEPTVTVARMDAEQSSVYRIDRDGLWRIIANDQLATALINGALADAQRAVAAAGESPAVTASARGIAENLLQHWAAANGWNLQIEWQTDRKPARTAIR